MRTPTPLTKNATRLAALAGVSAVIVTMNCRDSRPSSLSKIVPLSAAGQSTMSAWPNTSN